MAFGFNGSEANISIGHISLEAPIDSYPSEVGVIAFKRNASETSHKRMAAIRANDEFTNQQYQLSLKQQQHSGLPAYLLTVSLLPELASVTCETTL